MGWCACESIVRSVVRDHTFISIRAQCRLRLSPAQRQTRLIKRRRLSLQSLQARSLRTGLWVTSIHAATLRRRVTATRRCGWTGRWRCYTTHHNGRRWQSLTAGVHMAHSEVWARVTSRRTGRRSLLLPEIRQLHHGQWVAAFLRSADHFGRWRRRHRLDRWIASPAAITFTRATSRSISCAIGRRASVRVVTFAFPIAALAAFAFCAPLVRALFARWPRLLEVGRVRFASRSHTLDARVGAAFAPFAQWRRMRLILAAGFCVCTAPWKTSCQIG